MTTRLGLAARAAWDYRMQREAHHLGFLRKMVWEKRPTNSRLDDIANMRAAFERLLEHERGLGGNPIVEGYLRSILDEKEP